MKMHGMACGRKTEILLPCIVIIILNNGQKNIDPGLGEAWRLRTLDAVIADKTGSVRNNGSRAFGKFFAVGPYRNYTLFRRLILSDS